MPSTETNHKHTNQLGMTISPKHQKFDPFAKLLAMKTWVYTRGLYFFVEDFLDWTLNEVAWMVHDGPPDEPIPDNFLKLTTHWNVQLHGNEFISNTGNVHHADLFKILPIQLYRDNEQDLNFNEELQDIPRSMHYLLNRAILQNDHIAYYQNEKLIGPRSFKLMTPTLSLWLVLKSPEFRKNTVFILNHELKCQYHLPDDQPNKTSQYANQKIILAYLDVESIDGILSAIENPVLPEKTNESGKKADDDAQKKNSRYNERIKKGLLFFDILFNLKMSADQKADLLHKYFNIEKSEELRKDVDLLTLPLRDLQDFYDLSVEMREQFEHQNQILQEENKILSDKYNSAQDKYNSAQDKYNSALEILQILANKAPGSELSDSTILELCKEHGISLS